MKTLLATVAVLAAVTVVRAETQSPTTLDFLRGCKAWLDGRLVSWSVECGGIFYISSYWLGPHVGICMPGNSTIGQNAAVAIAYIEKRPERWHEPFPDLVVEALRAAWPCRADKK